eukprot:5439692-Pyramimonas_sp.AAC.1
MAVDCLAEAMLGKESASEGQTEHYLSGGVVPRSEHDPAMGSDNIERTPSYLGGGTDVILAVFDMVLFGGAFPPPAAP